VLRVSGVLWGQRVAPAVLPLQDSPLHAPHQILSGGSLHHYPHHIGDYRRDTIQLSLLEHGVYRQLLDCYYLDEKPLPSDANACCRAIGARSEEERAAVVQVLGEFFRLTDDGYKHRRCDKVLEEWYEKSGKARDSANARWAQSKGNANAMRTHSEGNATQYPIPNTQEDTSLRDVSGKPDVSAPGRKKLSDAAKELLAFLNEKTGRRYPAVESNIKLIASRLKEYPIEDLRAMIAKKAREWDKDENMEKYLRPKTLFNAQNCAQYIGELNYQEG
jgi:uncharacterized phage protein (TIGR02220 family)